MTGNEIRERIITNNSLIESEAKKGTFILSPIAREALEENEALRRQCDHSFDDLGFCIYCDWRKE